MKKRRLNKRGKIVLTILIILISAVIYVLMAKFGVKAQESTIALVGIVCAWIWLILGQFGVYYFIWDSEVRF